MTRPPRRSPKSTSRRARRRRTRAIEKREGVALLMAIITVAILAVMVADLHETTSTGYAIAIAERDSLRAEYMARSGLNLTRVIVAQGPALARIIAPVYAAVGVSPPSVMPVWNIASVLLRPFCDYASLASESDSAFDLASVKGLADMPGRCEVLAIAENSKLNVSDPLHSNDDGARRGVMMQLFAATGGFTSPSPYDAFFQRVDSDGQTNTRLDVISSIVDWWDADTSRTTFDAGTNTVGSSGSEDDPYSRYRDRYRIRNSPFDSVEELRLVRGVTDDFWATFIDPDPDDPRRRMVTVYGSGGVNPNEADPLVIINRLCSFIPTNTFCTADGAGERLKFVAVLRTARSILPLPLFGTPNDFVDFMKGNGALRRTLAPLGAFVGDIVPAPIVIPQDREGEVTGAFITVARILTIQSEGFAGRAHVRIRAVVNFDTNWRGPAPVPVTMPALGVFHHYRVD